MSEDQRPSPSDAVTPDAVTPDAVTLKRFADLSSDRYLQVLATGVIQPIGRMQWSSNATFLVTVTLESKGTLESEGCHAIYKPHRGERPLWDFPGGLFKREAAAWVVSEALGWHLVPETLLRADGPFGEGSLQRFVWGDAEQHYFTLIDNETHHDRLRRLAAFDIVVNNTDRKSGHCLHGDDGLVWAIDNGLCFHRDPKLRTVIWDFAGDPLLEDWRSDLRRLATDPPDALGHLLLPVEVDLVMQRAATLADLGSLPNPAPERRPYPWPLV